MLVNLKPCDETNVAPALHQLASIIRSMGLVLIFSDPLTEPKPVLESCGHASY